MTRFLTLLVVFTSLLTHSVTLAQQPALGAVASQEAERRKSTSGTVKTITNADLEEGGAAPLPSAPAEIAAKIVAASPAPVEATNQSRSTMELTMFDKADILLGPALARLSQRADTLNANARRYIDACYYKYTSGAASGVSVGRGAGYSLGAAVGSGGWAAWDAYSQFAWQESWAADTSVDNATTAFCRSLWSDVENDYAVVRRGLADVDELGRRAGIHPGAVRDLRASYGFKP